MTGNFKNKCGKVVKINRHKFQVGVSGCEIAKKESIPRPIGIHPSNLVITRLNMERNRGALIEKKAEALKQYMAMIKANN